MISTQDLRNKEVINIYDGKSLGFVYDIEVNLEKGIIEGIIVPAQRSFFNFFNRGDHDYIIKWKDIKRIGDDVILVDVAGVYDSEISYDRGYMSNVSNISGLDRHLDEEDEN
ncbi:PRC-barrel domain-containing protein [Sinanaerobacter chloroacetimidivorans]|jgi:YlmC/YmxH family sporulation protein|uniref:YlmC/YmxH family sporulation protein n=1 Tax=Sinanaerobacter chloroacetimidivorans TaxID=2818044 RepID=A0A8J8B372_9FIRM|nr:YlmC/YmxH family sporulation protein [Sinanaerobacter chloroacetimidivorans]MBR0599486.1 YlmC/YmxH family sporulation protein [Sinanaerobacter chloroacetimidivorans]